MHTNQMSSTIIPIFKLSVKNNDMEAVLFIEGRYDDSVINYEEIISLLNEKQISFGVDKTSIEKILKECQADPHGDKTHQTVVARGKPMIPARDGRIEFMIEEAPPVVIDENGQADFRNINRFKTVEKGQLLARKIPPVEEKPGFNVHGEEVSSGKKPLDPRLNAGPNVSEVPGKGEFISRIHGVYTKKKDTIDVSPVLEVPGHVGLESGNINYDGNLLIGGNIERGAVVNIRGNIEVRGCIESGNVSTSGSIKAKQGLNTKQEGMVKIAGNLSAEYIENSSVTVQGRVSVERSIIQSNIISYSDISLNAAGATISGGEIISKGSITTGILGNRSEILTKITPGVHYANLHNYKLGLKKLENIKKQFEKQSAEIQKIKLYVERMRGKLSAEKKTEFKVFFDAYKELAAEKKLLEEKIKKLFSERYNDQEVQIIVRETIYPGVEIHYRDIVEKITAPRTKVVLRFIPGAEKPVIEPWAEKKKT